MQNYLLTLEENRKHNPKVKNNPFAYRKYDNYDAIEIPSISALPCNYEGNMGVPITILDKGWGDWYEIMEKDTIIRPKVGNKIFYARIIIRWKKEVVEIFKSLITPHTIEVKIMN